MLRSRPALPTARRRVLVPWIVWVSLGEFAGFLIPLAAETLNLSLAVPDLPGFALLVAAGAGEGAVLGTVQGRLLRRELPQLRQGPFAAFTALAAALAWALGQLPSLTAPLWTQLPLWVVLPIGIVGGLLLVASIGTGQWLELRRAVARSWRWIPISAGAWLVGLGTFFAIAPPLWQEGQPLGLVVAIGALAAGGMAFAMAVVTGLGALLLVAAPRAHG